MLRVDENGVLTTRRPEATIEATPELKTASDLINRKHPKVTLAAFRKAYDRMMSNPDARPTRSALHGRALDKRFRICRSGGRDRGAQGFLLPGCDALALNAIFTYLQVPTPESWAAVKKGYDYYYNSFPQKAPKSVQSLTGSSDTHAGMARRIFNKSVRAMFETYKGSQ